MQCGQLKDCLGQSREQNAYGQPKDLVILGNAHVGGQPDDAGDHDHIEQNRPQAWNEKMSS
ncbi:hypothetical protein SDC9_168224 [bioreactor metagenome]|uniref:Uncharacterized protein n=1 Tax=bioreactor metagenome TaxID=1076179 RepID=A0A645G2I6_9ZZZZ